MNPDDAVWGQHHGNATALLSADGRYQYYLTRDLPGSAPPLHFVMLNPSKATASEDDPTIRRCLGYARALSAESLHVWNLFAWRTTHPDQLPQDESAIGPRNDATIAAALATAAATSAVVVAAWGAHEHPLKARQVARLLAVAGRHQVPLQVLAMTRRGDPGHPLRLPRSLRPRAAALETSCCPGCGCTDDQACWPACWWVPDASTVRVCSRCAGRWTP